MASVHSVEIFQISGWTTDLTINVPLGVTWIIREFCSYSGDGDAQIDVSQLPSGALLYRHVFQTVLTPNAPDTQLRHLVIASEPDGPMQQIEMKPYGAHFDLTISGYVLNGVYVEP